MKSHFVLLLVVILVNVTILQAGPSRRQAEKQNDKSFSDWLGKLFSNLLGSDKKSVTTPIPATPTSASTQTEQDGVNSTTSITNETTAEINKGPGLTNATSNISSNVSEVSNVSTPQNESFQNSSDVTNSSIVTSQTSTTYLPSSAEGSRTTTIYPKPSYTTTSSSSALSPMSTTSAQATTAAERTPSQKCLKPNNLGTYCELSPTFLAYMNQNDSFEHLASKLFSANIVHTLIEKCPPGDWCLSDSYITAFSEAMDSFYTGPLCLEGLFICLNVMFAERVTCPAAKEIETLGNSLNLLCDLPAIPGLRSDCFGHVVAMLHLTMADRIRRDNTTKKGDYCETPKAHMTKQFLCTSKHCPNRASLLRDFGMWNWFMVSSETVQKNCDMKQPCENADQTPTTPMFLSSTVSPQTYTTTTSLRTATMGSDAIPSVRSNKTGFDVMTTGSPLQHAGPTDKPFFLVVTTEGTTRLVIGVATGTIVALMGLTVMFCACYKRARRANALLYRDGYTKLPSEEGLRTQ